MENKSSLFELVAKGDDVNLQRLLLEAKEERNVATLAHGNTVLHEAAWNGFSRCVRVLCNVYPKDFDENFNKEKISGKKNHFINRVNFCGFSALHLAAQNGHNQTLRELLYAGCSTSIHNDYGDTALHTACRYGHAGVVRILISAKCDVNAFNLNHDTPLHITCAMGRRKLTKLLLEADAMQFQNLNHETPLDIARRKNLREIIEIMTTYKEKLEKKKLKEAANSPDQILTYNSKHKNTRQHWSPYGCHYYPDTRNFPPPNIESLPKEPLEKGEQYYLDLAGNICKGPIGQVKQCCCTMPDQKRKCAKVQPFDKEGIRALADQFMRTAIRSSKPKSTWRNRKQKDLFHPLMGVVKDENKRLHMEQWLYKVYPEIGSNSDLLPKDDLKSQEVAVDLHREPMPAAFEPKQMRSFDHNGNNDETYLEDDDENYTDVSNDSGEESENGSIDSGNENRMYDENFMQNFQRQQLNARLDDSVTSPSVGSNQNIEHEMERITKSLLTGGLMVSTNPDVIRDHIHHSAKRSTNKTKSAITKSTVLASGDLYVNTFFSNSKSVARDNSNPSTVSSPIFNESQNLARLSIKSKQSWNQAVRSRNPLPLDIDELEKLQTRIDSTQQIVSATLNNVELLDKQLKARKTFNQNYQQQLEAMGERLNESQLEAPNFNGNHRISNIPSSSTLV